MRKAQRERLERLLDRWSTDRLSRVIRAVQQGVERWTPEGSAEDTYRLLGECSLCNLFYASHGGARGCLSTLCPLAVMYGSPCDAEDHTPWSRWNRATVRQQWAQAARWAQRMRRDLQGIERVLSAELHRRKRA